MEREEYIYRWNFTYRIHHWLIVLAAAVLALTGFYIHWPFLRGTPGGIDLMGWMRFSHFVAGYALILGLVVRIYLAFMSTFCADWREFGIWRNLRNVPSTLGYYLFIKPTHEEHGRYNPLQALTYLFWVFLILFLTVTGFALYRGKVFGIMPAPDSFQWVNTLLGGESYTRIWHYLATWLFLITVTAHVYMASLTAWVNRDHTFRSIMSGYKLKPRRA
jgi:Ni/Fe-hydrogenase 1 B-type cytochrome subunit